MVIYYCIFFSLHFFFIELELELEFASGKDLARNVGEKTCNGGR